MTDIIKELFESSFYDDCGPTEKVKALRKQEADLWDKVLPILGLDTIDEINNTQAAITREINLQWFREGFHLGVSFMLEVFQG